MPQSRIKVRADQCTTIDALYNYFTVAVNRSFRDGGHVIVFVRARATDYVIALCVTPPNTAQSAPPPHTNIGGARTFGQGRCTRLGFGAW